MPRRKKKQGLDYKDHTPMLRNIPDYFYSALAGELVSVFSPTIFDKDEDGLMGLDLCTGTGGWNAALEMTCKKLDLMWLYSYYLTLTWYDSDRFDSDIYENMKKLANGEL